MLGYSAVIDIGFPCCPSVVINSIKFSENDDSELCLRANSDKMIYFSIKNYESFPSWDALYAEIEKQIKKRGTEVKFSHAEFESAFKIVYPLISHMWDGERLFRDINSLGSIADITLTDDIAYADVLNTALRLKRGNENARHVGTYLMVNNKGKNTKLTRVMAEYLRKTGNLLWLLDYQK